MIKIITSTISIQKDNIFKTVNIAKYNYQASTQPPLNKKQNLMIFNEGHKATPSEFNLNLKEMDFDSNLQVNTSYWSQQRKYLELYDITSDNAWEYLKDNNFELLEPLWQFLYDTKLYLHQKEKFYRLSIDLEESVEEPDFKLLVLLIETNILNLDEEIMLINDIGEIFDKIALEAVLIKGEEFNEKLAPIIYLFGELKYASASIIF